MRVGNCERGAWAGAIRRVAPPRVRRLELVAEHPAEEERLAILLAAFRTGGTLHLRGLGGMEMSFSVDPQPDLPSPSSPRPEADHSKRTGGEG